MLKEGASEEELVESRMMSTKADRKAPGLMLRAQCPKQRRLSGAQLSMLKDAATEMD